MLRSTEPLDRIYIQFADNGNIRKWQRDPFEGGVPYLASLPSDDEGRVCERLEKCVSQAETARQEIIAADLNGWPNAILGLIEVATEAAALLQSQAAELAAANERVTAAVDDYNDVLARAERAEAALAEKDKALDIAESAIEAHYDPIYQSESDDKVHLLGLIRAARRAHSKDGGEHG